MNDPMLMNRLNAFEQNLRKVDGLLTAFTRVRVTDRVWNGLQYTIAKRATELMKKIAEIRKCSDASMAWRDYERALNQSHPIFQESLELLLGLAFRELQNDEFDIWRIADWVVLDCSDATLYAPSLTVPAAREALRKTIARLIRLRFPECNIWTLPFAAQEYGHVLLAPAEGNERAGHLANVVTQMEAKFSDQGAQVVGLIADAFATYYMGPAYAAATIHLRLDPAGAHDVHGEYPADHTRARVILETLRVLGHAEVCRRLDGSWQSLLSRARPDGALPSMSERAAEFAECAVEKFGDELPRSALYDEAEALRAQTLHKIWSQELDSGVHDLTSSEGAITAPSFQGKLKPRHVINAAWLCRIYRDDGLERVVRAAATLCRGLILLGTKSQDDDLRGQLFPGVQGGVVKR